MSTPAIRAMARKGVDTAFAAAGDAVVKATLRLLPTNTYDAETDATVTTWAFEKADLQCIAYDDTEERPTMDPEVKRRNFLFKGVDLGDVPGEQEGTVTDEKGATWNIWLVETDPTANVWIFYARGPTPAPTP